MHIPNGMLSPPVLAATGLVAAAGFGLGLRRLEHRLRDRTTVLMGTMAAFVFAAQMVKFPVAPGVAGHLMGGVLAAVLLGPWAGAVALGAVLIVQCLIAGDGGLTALGANFVNLGLIGAVGGYAIYAPIRRTIGGRSGVLIGAMVAAWFTVILAAGAVAVEVWASGSSGDFGRLLGMLTLVHAGIGVGEAIVTGLVLRSLLLARPDLIDEAPISTATRWTQTAVGGLAIAAAVAVFATPFASEWPDGLEWVVARLGLAVESSPSHAAPLADYQLPGVGSLKLATAAAGLVGTLVVFGVGLGLARAFAREPAARAVVDVG